MRGGDKLSGLDRDISVISGVYGYVLDGDYGCNPDIRFIL